MNPQLAADIAEMTAVGAKKSSLTLFQEKYGFYHHIFCPRNRLKCYLITEMSSEKIMEDITLWLRVVVGMFKESTKIIQYGGIDPG